MKLSKVLLSLLVAGLLPQLGIAAVSDTHDHASNVQAQWQPRELNFHYMGLSTYYSCTAIEDRLEQLLRDLGAKPDVRVSATGCFTPSDVSKMISARIRLSMPVAADGAAPTKDVAAFPAQHKVVTLRTHPDNQFGSGDCELLEQVRNQLVPALKLQIVKDDLHCIPGQATVGNQTVQVATLVATPDEKGGK